MNTNSLNSLLPFQALGADIRLFLQQQAGTENSESFLTNLLEQLQEAGDDESLQSVAGILNGLLENNEIETVGGQFLPPPAISDPKSLLDGQQHEILGLADDATDSVLHPKSALSALLPAVAVDKSIPNPGQSSSISQSQIQSLLRDSSLNAPLIRDDADENLLAFNSREGLNVQSQQESRIVAPKLPVVTIQKPFAQPGWQQDFGERITWVVNKAMESAQLRLNPPQLGPVEVRVNFSQDQANVAFSSQNTAVREAIESAIPRLRDLMSNQQLNLGDVDVSPHSFTDQRGSGQHENQNNGELEAEPEVSPDVRAQENTENEGLTISSNGLLSYYV